MESLHLFRTQAHNPRVLQRMFAGNLLDAGAIDQRTRELVILRTCARCAWSMSGACMWPCLPKLPA